MRMRSAVGAGGAGSRRSWTECGGWAEMNAVTIRTGAAAAG